MSGPGESRVGFLPAGMFLLLLGACAGSSVQDGLVVTSDPELRTLAAELLPDLAARAGLDLRRPVRLERRSREQLVAYLTAKLDEELPPELAVLLTRSYSLLGMVPSDLDLRGLLLSVYTEQVAGFYDPDSAALFVMEDQPAETLRTVLIHELVHAVQDQAVDLDSLTDRSRGNDRLTAAQAAIEGHATLVMLEYAMEQMQGAPVDLSKVDAFGGQLRAAMGGVRAGFPALANAPRVIQEALLFPYLEGAGFVQLMWRAEGARPAPFGENLPQSTEQILDPQRLVGPVRDDPQELALRIPGARTLHSDVLGQLEAGLLVDELSGQRGTTNSAAGWRGDRYALLETAAGDALVWVSLWDGPAQRDAFLALLATLLERLPKPSRLEAIELGEAPGIVLRVGEVGEVEASLVGAP